MSKNIETAELVDGEEIVASFRKTVIKKIIVTSAVCAGVLVANHLVKKIRSDKATD